MLTKSKLIVILVVLLNLVSVEAIAKERRGDDFVVSFNVSADRSPTAGFWAMISTNKPPALTLVQKKCPPPGLYGLGNIGCKWENEQNRSLNIRASNQRWVSISKNSPSSVIGADINGDGRDELVANYSSKGTYIIRDIHTGTPRWEKILNVAANVLPADFNGNGKADLVMLVDEKKPLNVRMDNGKVVKINPTTPKFTDVFNLDGKYRDDLVAVFRNKAGLFIRRNKQAWVRVHAKSPVNYWRADIDGDGRDNIIADFGSVVGTYARSANGKWTKIWAGSPTSIEPADLNGNGRDDLVFYINNNKTSVRMDNGKWYPLLDGLTRVLAAGDIDGNGKDDLVFSLSGRGSKGTSTWAWMNNSKWAEIANGEALGNLAGVPGPGSCGLGLGGLYGYGVGQVNCGWIPNSSFVGSTYTFANLDGR